MYFAVQISRVTFMAKISLNLFSLGLKQVWTYSVPENRIYELKKVTYIVMMAGDQNRELIVAAGLNPKPLCQ